MAELGSKHRFICSDPKPRATTLNHTSPAPTTLPPKLCGLNDLKNIFQSIKFPKQNILNINELLTNSGILLKILTLWKGK